MRLLIHFPESSLGSLGAGSFSHVGSTPQISRAYSAMVRSDENLPDDAMLWIAISTHLFWLKYVSLTLS